MKITAVCAAFQGRTSLSLAKPLLAASCDTVVGEKSPLYLLSLKHQDAVERQLEAFACSFARKAERRGG